MKELAISLILLGSVVSCNPVPPNIAGFEYSSWRNDKFGCSNVRAEMAEALLVGRNEIIGLQEPEVLKFLGKADVQEIYSRNQKFLIYYIEPNSKCSPPVMEKAKAVHVRINAIGVANEIYIMER